MHKLDNLTPGKYELNPGQVNCVAILYIDGKEVGKAGMPPYAISFDI